MLTKSPYTSFLLINNAIIKITAEVVVESMDSARILRMRGCMKWKLGYNSVPVSGW